jgi:iron complex transport system substrate-binding protein
LAPSCTEILFALGLGDKVVGVDTYSDYPSEVPERVEAGNLTIVGSFADISTETVVGLEPDLIVATGGVQRVVVENLERIGQTVMVLYPNKFDGVLADISLVGKVTGQTDEAEEIVTDMQNRAQEIAEKVQSASKPRVYVEVSFNGGYWSFGADAYASELIEMAGGVNVFSTATGGHISVSSEQVIAANPEIIIVSKGSMATAAGLTPETIRGRSAWKDISAVKNDQIFQIEETTIVRGVPRLIEGLEGFAKLIHPELFS